MNSSEGFLKRWLLHIKRSFF